MKYFSIILTAKKKKSERKSYCETIGLSEPIKSAYNRSRRLLALIMVHGKNIKRKINRRISKVYKLIYHINDVIITLKVNNFNNKSI